MLRLAVASPVGACVLIAGGLAHRFFAKVLEPLILRIWGEYMTEWRADRELLRQKALANGRLAVGVNRLAEAIEKPESGNGQHRFVKVR